MISRHPATRKPAWTESPVAIAQLASLITGMLESPTLETALQSLATSAKAFLGAGNCQILELAGDGEVAIAAFSQQPSFAVTRMFLPSGPLGSAWASDEPEGFLGVDPDFPGAAASEFLCMALPRADASPLLLVVGHTQPGGKFTPGDADALQQLVRLAAPVLAQLVRHDLLQQQLVEYKRLARDANAAQRAKTAFLSRMSHDLRTPLSSVLGFAQLLEMENLTEQQREYVELIYQGGQRLLRLTDQVLDLTQVDAGKLTLITQPINVGDAVSEAVSLTAPLARSKSIHVAVHQQPGVQQLSVNADLQRLKQILLNLLSNAIKYTQDHGKVRILIGITESAHAAISVSDTGPGIPASKLSALFAPFERLGLNMEAGGTGLGLTLTKALVEAMGGDITVKSMPGAGSTFTISLPAASTPA